MRKGASRAFFTGPPPPMGAAAALKKLESLAVPLAAAALAAADGSVSSSSSLHSTAATVGLAAAACKVASGAPGQVSNRKTRTITPRMCRGMLANTQGRARERSEVVPVPPGP